MMHVEFTTLMSAVLDHEAPPGDVRRLQEHLASCEACARTWARWQSLDSLFVAAPLLTPPPGFVLAVSQRLEQRRRQTRRRRWVGGGLLLAWAGLFAALWLVVLGLVLWGVAHPALLAQVTGWGAGIIDSVAGILRGARGALQGIGVWQLSLGLGFYLGLTVIVASLWMWLMARKSGWSEALAVARDASA